MASSCSSMAIMRRTLTTICSTTRAPTLNFTLNNNKFLNHPPNCLCPLHNHNHKRCFSDWVSPSSLNQEDNKEERPFSSFPFMMRSHDNDDSRTATSKDGTEGLLVTMEIPGQGKDNMEVHIRKSTSTKLVVNRKDGSCFYTKDLKTGLYKTDQIRTELRNGLLSLFLPKFKKDEINKEIECINLLNNDDHDYERENNINLDSPSSLFSDVFDDVFPRSTSKDPCKIDGGDGLYLSTKMPGLGKEDVEVSLDVEEKMLIIKEVGDKIENYNLDLADCKIREKGYRKCIKLPPMGNYKNDQVVAEMKNGVLRVLIPKLIEKKIGVEVKGE